MSNKRAYKIFDFENGLSGKATLKQIGRNGDVSWTTKVPIKEIPLSDIVVNESFVPSENFGERILSTPDTFIIKDKKTNSIVAVSIEELYEIKGIDTDKVEWVRPYVMRGFKDSTIEEGIFIKVKDGNVFMIPTVAESNYLDKDRFLLLGKFALPLNKSKFKEAKEKVKNKFFAYNIGSLYSDAIKEILKKINLYVFGKTRDKFLKKAYKGNLDDLLTNPIIISDSYGLKLKSPEIVDRVLTFRDVFIFLKNKRSIENITIENFEKVKGLAISDFNDTIFKDNFNSYVNWWLRYPLDKVSMITQQIVKLKIGEECK
jgi:hypothetical protein